MDVILKVFTLSFKINAKQIITCCCALGIIAGGFVMTKNFINKKVEKTSVSVSESIENLPKIKINDDRIKIANMLGWEIDGEPLEIEEIIIPDKFDEVYTKYNELQKSVGFDLEKHKGDKCKRYCYKVKNYKGENDVVMNMIVYKNKLIGGDISSRELGGFMKPLLTENNK